MRQRVQTEPEGRETRRKHGRATPGGSTERGYIQGDFFWRKKGESLTRHLARAYVRFPATFLVDAVGTSLSVPLTGEEHDILIPAA